MGQGDWCQRSREGFRFNMERGSQPRGFRILETWRSFYLSLGKWD